VIRQRDIENPNDEIRNPNQIRNHNDEPVVARIFLVRHEQPMTLTVRISSFALDSDF